MKKVIGAFLIATAVISCRNAGKTVPVASGDEKFRQISEEFISGYLDWRPDYGVYLGLHEYDGKSPDLSIGSITKELARLKLYDQMLDGFDTASLSHKTYYDLRILQYGIKNEIFYFDDMASYRKNPMTYASVGDLSIYIKRNFAPLEERLKSVIAIEKNIPGIIADAKSNLYDSLARPLIELAVQIAEGGADFLENDLVLGFKDVNNDSLLAVFKILNDKAITEIKSFADYLEKEKLPKSTNYYALGKEKFEKMLRHYEGITITPEKLLEVGLAELEKEKNAFVSAAKIIDPGKRPMEVLQTIQRDHPTSESLINDIKRNIGNIKQFIIDKQIVTMPVRDNLIIEETPKFLRSYGFAAMDPPGALEKIATEAFYYITPVDPSWTVKQKEEVLSMFDYYTSDIISIHEVYPGHYIQLARLNESSATNIEKIFGSYAFVEGWAHYTEKIMIDEGFGNTGDPVVAAKYRMAQSGEALLRLCRLCVSVKMHCEGMSVDEATKFLMDNWYHGEKPSNEEAKRATYDPGYLFYSLGKLMILKLRQDYQKQEGDNFSLLKFHDLILDHGMPQIILLREELLKDKNTWNEIL